MTDQGTEAPPEKLYIGKGAYTTLARLTGRGYSAIRQNVTRGRIKLHRDEGGEYLLTAEAIAAMKKIVKAGVTTAALYENQCSPDIAAANLRLMSAKADREELTVKRMRGELVEISAAKELVSSLAAEVKTAIQGLHSREAHRLAEASGISPEAAGLYLRQLASRLLAQLEGIG